MKHINEAYEMEISSHKMKINKCRAHTGRSCAIKQAPASCIGLCYANNELYTPALTKTICSKASAIWQSPACVKAFPPFYHNQPVAGLSEQNQLKQDKNTFRRPSSITLKL